MSTLGPDVTAPTACFLVRSLPRGGLEAVLLDHALGAQDAGWAPEVVCLESSGVRAPEFRAAGVPVHALDLPASSLGAALHGPGRLRAYLAQRRPGFLQVHMRRAGLLGRVAAAAEGVPTVVALHNFDPPPPAWAAGLERWLDARSRFLAVSASVADHHGHRSAAPIPVIANSLARPARRRRAREPGPGARVGFLGKAEPKKGPDRFLRLVEALRHRGRGVEASLAGPLPAPRGLRRLASGAGVRVLGPVEDGPGFLAELDLAVFPSRREGFGLAVAEALSVGTPVLLSDIPPFREVYGALPEACFLPGSASPARWASAAARLLDDGPLRREVQARGRALLEAAPPARARAGAARLYGRWREELGGPPPAAS